MACGRRLPGALPRLRARAAQPVKRRPRRSCPRSACRQQRARALRPQRPRAAPPLCGPVRGVRRGRFRPAKARPSRPWGRGAPALHRLVPTLSGSTHPPTCPRSCLARAPPALRQVRSLAPGCPTRARRFRCAHACDAWSARAASRTGSPSAGRRAVAPARRSARRPRRARPRARLPRAPGQASRASRWPRSSSRLPARADREPASAESRGRQGKGGGQRERAARIRSRPRAHVRALERRAGAECLRSRPAHVRCRARCGPGSTSTRARPARAVEAQLRQRAPLERARTARPAPPVSGRVPAARAARRRASPDRAAPRAPRDARS